jgi:two-component system CheB/CheR fusion protein
VSERKEIEHQLLEASRAKSRFLAAASHDLRQPIQTLNLLNRAARSTATGRAHQTIIEKQQKSLDSMSRLLNSLLNISKLEAGVVRPDIEDCAVQRIFDDLRAEFEDQARDKGLKLIIDRCEDVVHSDPQLLIGILENLISNAIRYTQEGFVRLRCFHRDLSIRLEVLDTGLGIPSDELDRIFEEFHQVDHGPSRPEGLGLGLSIVKRTAELLGCSLEVSSNPGEGSVFSVTVPRGDGPRLPDVVAKPEPLIATAGGRILLVDDEPAVVDATRMVLELEGFDVLTAASGGEAVTRITEMGEAPDLLITDYHLRDQETGLNVIDAVRGQLRSSIPVIVISGDTSDRVVIAGLEDTTVLTKPVDVDELLVEIHRQIGSR